MYFLSDEFGSPIKGICYKSNGGPSGSVRFADYIEDVHKNFLGAGGGIITPTFSIGKLMMDAFVDNPLENFSYTDPSTSIIEVKGAYDTWDSDIQALDDSIDWEVIVGNAVSTIDSQGVLKSIDIETLLSNLRQSTKNTLREAIEESLSLLDSEIVERAVVAYVNSRKLDRAHLRTRYKASMHNVGAERSSAYAIGMALLESSFEDETGRFQTELSTNLTSQNLEAYMKVFSEELTRRVQISLIEKQTRDQILMQGIQQILQYREFILSLKRNLVELLQEITRIGFVMDSEYVANTADLNWRHASWRFEAYAAGMNVLGGLSGSTFVPNKPSQLASSIGGALQGFGTGAATGTAIGAAGGPIGAAGGAAIGALLGGLAGFF